MIKRRFAAPNQTLDSQGIGAIVLKKHFLILLIANFALLAHSAPVEFSSDPADESSFSTLIPEARKGVQATFLELIDREISSGFYVLPKSFPYLGSLILTRYNDFQPATHCQLIFCNDRDLAQKLSSQVRAGRLILVTHSFVPFNAATVQDKPEVLEFKKRFSDVDPKLNIIIITPKTTRDVLMHELVHAVDNESENLTELENFLRSLVSTSQMTLKSSNKINTFIAEIRAYDRERTYCETNVRAREWQVDEDDKNFSIATIEINSETFLRRRLWEFDFKVSMYQSSALDVLNDPSLSIENKTEIRSKLKELMPSDGPYSYSKLLAP